LTNDELKGAIAYANYKVGLERENEALPGVLEAETKKKASLTVQSAIYHSRLKVCRSIQDQLDSRYQNAVAGLKQRSGYYISRIGGFDETLAIVIALRDVFATKIANAEAIGNQFAFLKGKISKRKAYFEAQLSYMGIATDPEKRADRRTALEVFGNEVPPPPPPPAPANANATNTTTPAPANPGAPSANSTSSGPAPTGAATNSTANGSAAGGAGKNPTSSGTTAAGASTNTSANGTAPSSSGTGGKGTFIQLSAREDDTSKDYQPLESYAHYKKRMLMQEKAETGAVPHPKMLMRKHKEAGTDDQAASPKKSSLFGFDSE
jgi:hypothetical protein